MPTYQYACTQCDTRLEAVQSFSDPALTDCPACHGTLRKVFSAVGVVFKGSGFYKNDSRSSGPGGAAKKDAAAASTSSGDGGSSGSTGSSGSSGSSGSTGSSSGSTPASTGAAAAPAAKSA